MKRHITADSIALFQQHLILGEHSPGTVEKYLRDLRALRRFAGEDGVTRETVLAWKEHLVARRYAVASLNSMLAAVNAFFRFAGWEECRLKALRWQRRTFRSDDRELTREEYERLLSAARATGRERLALLMETLCATGIRVSEVPYITLEAARAGRADISLKGKVRTILLPRKLCDKLRRYARANKIASGEIFLTGGGSPLSRKQIWAQMKALAETAGIAPSKVFPHNLRHLFARAFYQASRDVAKLADVLGHSSLETTRLYLVSTGKEHARQLEGLGLVS